MHSRDVVAYLGSPGLGIAVTFGIAATFGMTCVAHSRGPRVSAVPAPTFAVHEEPAPPPEREVAALPPAPIGTTCPADVTTIGRPIALSDALPSDGTNLGASADPESCLIAAWNAERLYVSWDGGASFTNVALPKSTFRLVGTSNDRVLVVLDDRLGVMQRGDTSLLYRSIPAHVPEFGVEQVGRWLAIPVGDDVIVTGDDGLTWRTVAMPPGDTRWYPGMLYRLDADGTLVSRANETLEWLDVHPPANVVYDATLYRWYVLRAGAQAWSRVSREPDPVPRRTATGWSYSFELDKSWGCGSSEKLVATHGSKRVVVQGDLRRDVRDIALAYGSHGAFMQTYLGEPGLAELVGAQLRFTSIPYEWFVQLVGVDGAGTPILTAGGQLLRWSKSGGWRVLGTRASSR